MSACQAECRGFESLLSLQGRRIKMADKVSVNMGGGFTGLLTLLFIALKLTGQITWSWWWVFAPLWIPFLIVIGVVVLIGIVSILK